MKKTYFLTRAAAIWHANHLRANDKLATPTIVHCDCGISFGFKTHDAYLIVCPACSNNEARKGATHDGN